MDLTFLWHSWRKKDFTSAPDFGLDRPNHNYFYCWSFTEWVKSSLATSVVPWRGRGHSRSIPSRPFLCCTRPIRSGVLLVLVGDAAPTHRQTHTGNSLFIRYCIVVHVCNICCCYYPGKCMLSTLLQHGVSVYFVRVHFAKRQLIGYCCVYNSSGWGEKCLQHPHEDMPRTVCEMWCEA